MRARERERPIVGLGDRAGAADDTALRRVVTRGLERGGVVALVVSIVFVSAVAAIDLALIVVPLFVLAMGCLMVAVVLFLREVQLATGQMRRRF